MNIILLQNSDAFTKLSREKLFAAHLVGYWNIDGTLTVCKDRHRGCVGGKIYDFTVAEYVNVFS